MATPTDAELLADCNQQISDLLKLGKSRTLVGSESVQYEGLAELLAARRELELRIAGDTLRNVAYLEDQL